MGNSKANPAAVGSVLYNMSLKAAEDPTYEVFHVYRLDIRKSLKTIFTSAYESYGPVYNLIGIRGIELTVVIIVFFFGIGRILQSILYIPVYHEELHSLKERYSGQLTCKGKERVYSTRVGNQAFIKLMEKFKNNKDHWFYRFLFSSIEETTLKTSDIDRDEYINSVLERNRSSILAIVAALAVNSLFFIRATGISTYIFDAVKESHSFIISLFLVLQVILHMFIFLLLMVFSIDKDGKYTTVISIMFASMLSFGYLSIFDGAQAMFYSLFFYITKSPLFLNVTFACLGAFLHRVISNVIRIFISHEADQIINEYGLHYYTDILRTTDETQRDKMLSAFKKSIGESNIVENLNSGLLDVKEKYIDIYLSEIHSLSTSVGTSKNLFIFSLICVFSYIVIYEIDRDAIFYIYMYKPIKNRMKSFCENLRVEWLIIIKLCVYSIAILLTYGSFWYFSM